MADPPTPPSRMKRTLSKDHLMKYAPKIRMPRSLSFDNALPRFPSIPKSFSFDKKEKLPTDANQSTSPRRGSSPKPSTTTKARASASTETAVESTLQPETDTRAAATKLLMAEAEKRANAIARERAAEHAAMLTVPAQSDAKTRCQMQPSIAGAIEAQAAAAAVAAKVAEGWSLPMSPSLRMALSVRASNDDIPVEVAPVTQSLNWAIASPSAPAAAKAPVAAADVAPTQATLLATLAAPVVQPGADEWLGSVALSARRVSSKSPEARSMPSRPPPQRRAPSPSAALRAQSPRFPALGRVSTSSTPHDQLTVRERKILYEQQLQAFGIRDSFESNEPERGATKGLTSWAMGWAMVFAIVAAVAIADLLAERSVMYGVLSWSITLPALAVAAIADIVHPSM